MGLETAGALGNEGGPCGVAAASAAAVALGKAAAPGTGVSEWLDESQLFSELPLDSMLTGSE